MNKKKICKIAGVAVAGIAFAVGGIYVGSQQTHTAYRYPALSNVVTTANPMTANKLSTLEGEQHAITLHFKWEGAQPHIAYKVDETGVSTTTPGVPMRDEGNGWYTYTITDAEVANMAISIPELDYTTSDFNRSEGEYWYDQNTGWYTSEPAIYEKTEDKETVEKDETEVVEDIADVAAGSNITVHFPSSMSDANIYAWNALPEDIVMEWPGETLEEEEDGYYSYTFSDVTKVNFLFNNDTEQTEDFRISGAGEYWYSDGKWENKEPDGEEAPEKTDAPEQTKKPDDNDPNATTEPIVTIAPGTGESANFKDTRTDFRDESIYFLMTTRFYDGDPGNNARGSHDEDVKNPASDPSWRGDFKGLIEKLDYIKALGFTSVWITPVVENKSRSGYDYHGYHAYNFKKVDQRYLSSDTSYQDLINACHEKGIKIIQDIVLNHSGGYGEQNLQTFSSNSEATIAAEDGNGYYNHSYIKSWESYDCQITSIDGDCLDLNTENTHVIQYLKEAYDQYINMGIDGFRIDTMKHISRLTFNKEFAPHFMETAKNAGKDNFYMFGEVCARDENALYFGNFASLSAFFYTWAENDDYAWGDTGTNVASVKQHWDKYSNYAADKAKKEFNSDNAFLQGNNYHTPDYSKSSGMGVIDFPMHWAFRDAKNAYNRALQDDAYYNDATWNVVYVDSHDYAPNTMEKIRYSGTTENWAENMDVMFTFRGIPCIYYGSEIEFQKGKTIDGYSDMLSNTGRAYFGDNIEGDITASDFGEYTASGTAKETLSKPLAVHLQTLNKIRQAVPALRKGQYSTEGCNGNMAFKRRYTDDKVDSFACVAISGDATFSGLPGGTYTDCVTGDVQTVSEGGTLNVKCSGTANLRVYVLDTAKTSAPGKVGNGSNYMK